MRIFVHSRCGKNQSCLLFTKIVTGIFSSHILGIRLLKNPGVAAVAGISDAVSVHDVLDVSAGAVPAVSDVL